MRIKKATGYKFKNQPYSAYNFQKLRCLILTATTIVIFMDVDFGQHSLVGSVEGLFVSLELITFGALLSLMWLSPLAQQFKDEDENVNDDVIEMGQDAEPMRDSWSCIWNQFQ